jgi:UDP-glucose 4-epimerase
MKNKKVLVTGGSGFIGSHLIKRLLKEGAKVTLMTRYNSVIKNIRLKDYWNHLNVLEADLRNVDSLSLVKGIKPDVVYHLGAYNHVGTSFIHVSEVFDVNAKGTANLMQAYEDYEKFIYISTSEIYGFQKSVPFKEDMNPAPISPYAIGKYSGELFARLKQQIGKPVVVIRPFNTFGPYQSTKAIIPEITINCLEGRTIKATEGKQTREFNYVEDIVAGLILAAQKEQAVGQIMNLGSGLETSIKELILKIAKLTQSSSKIEMGALPNRPAEIWRMCADNTKAKRILGWSPKISFEAGLRQTIEWYRQNAALWKDEGAI